MFTNKLIVDPIISDWVECWFNRGESDTTLNVALESIICISLDGGSTSICDFVCKT